MNTKRWLRGNLAVALAAMAAAAAVWAVEGGTATAERAAGQGHAQVKAAALVHDVALARSATAKYVTNLALARQNGYGIITKMIPNMGYHFMNPNVKGFDPAKPAILVYEKSGSTWQLAALEWVYTSKPAKAPFPGARYGAFGAGCHYADGTFVPSQTQDGCPQTAPGTGAKFGFWHPLLVTLHVWLWYPNPTGLFAGTNPLVSAYNGG
jgi:hypothetical protein